MSFPLCPLKIFLLLLAIVVLLAPGCGRHEEFQVQGATMGTVYTVRMVDAPAGIRGRIGQDIVRRLEELNAIFSVYRPDSEISRFNTLSDWDQPVAVSQDFQHVFRASLHVHQLTQGAFDPTVKPLLDLWGFGTAAKRAGPWQPPEEKAVEQALESVGLEAIDASAPGWLRKTNPHVQLDFGGVAKGYAVDEIVTILRRHDIEHFLVNIGGDILASGNSSSGGPWRVGVNRPVPDATWDDVLMFLHVPDKAVATSGDYRRHYLHEGLLYSHILDPRTGRPVHTPAAGVTVIADSAVLADALATGLLVLGVDQGLAVVEQLSGVEALFLIRKDAGEHEPYMSSGFGRYLANE